MIESCYRGNYFPATGGIRRFGVCGFCLCWHIADGEVAKMTDEERRELIAYLRNPGHDFRGDKALAEEIIVAADEIERLAKELEKMGRWYNAAQKQLWAMKDKYSNY